MEKRSRNTLIIIIIIIMCYWMAASRPRNMLVHLKDGSVQTAVHTDRLKQKLQIKLATSPSHDNIQMSGQPVQRLIV